MEYDYSGHDYLLYVPKSLQNCVHIYKEIFFFKEIFFACGIIWCID